MAIVISFLLALLGAYLSTPLCRELAKRWGVMDQPGGRKVHRQSTPYLGGVAILVGILSGMGATWGAGGGALFGPVMILALGITLVGVVDDIWSIRPVVKLGGQLLIAGGTIMAGISVPSIAHPAGGQWIVGALHIPFAMLWMVGMMNMINLIDGLDGLAGGVSVISAICLGIVSIMGGNIPAGIMAVCIAGAGIGFLKYNTNPATIFMGDAGSLLLGYMLSVISMLGVFNSTHTFSSAIPIIVLAIPILDTAFAIVRRLRRGQPIFSADKDHFHHQLLRSGYTVKQSVGVIYVISLALSLVGFGVGLGSTPTGVWVILVVTVLCGGIRWGMTQG